MMSRNPLLIAKRHGHRILTMPTVYAAWTEGAVEADFWAIHNAMYRYICGHRTGDFGNRFQECSTARVVDENQQLNLLTPNKSQSNRLPSIPHFGH
jgi:hypothetical protein